MGTWLLGQQVLRVGITDILSIVNIIDIADVADIIIDIIDTVMDIVDIINIIDIAVETSKHAQGVTKVSCNGV